MITREQFIAALDIVEKYKQQCYNDIYLINNVENHELKTLRETSLLDIDISVRCKNQIVVYFRDILNEHNYVNLFVSDLAKISIREFKRMRNVGAKSIKELKALCNKAKINLLD